MLRSRLRVDTRKWVLSKMLPKLYGDKLQHTGEGGGAVLVRITIDDAAARDDADEDPRRQCPS